MHDMSLFIRTLAMLSVYYGSCTDWRWLLYGMYRNSSFPVTATDVSMETALTPSRETAKVISLVPSVSCAARGVWYVVCGLGRAVCGVGCGAGGALREPVPPLVSPRQRSNQRPPPSAAVCEARQEYQVSAAAARQST